LKGVWRISLATRLGLAVFMVLILATLCLPLEASATENTNVSVSPPAQAVDAGQQFHVTIDVAPGAAMAGMQFDLSFDSSVVVVDLVEEGNLLRQGGATTFFNPGKIDNQAGTITGVFGAIAGRGESVSSEGAFAVITMTARAQRDNWTLALSNVIVGDMDGNALPVSFENSVSPSVTADTPVFRWWVLSVIFGVALLLITATIVGVLLRRRQMLRAMQGTRR
jgi:hypothetical protein